MLFNWPENKKQDFYSMIADEANINTVYIGEVICQKRFACWGKIYHKIVDRLVSAGKEVIISSLALINTEEELHIIRDYIKDSNLTIEANDISVLNIIDQNKFCLGPYINIYNEEALKHYIDKGASHITFSQELPRESIEVLASLKKIDYEISVFGRIPLAISARCAHARVYKQQKSNCKYVCEKDLNGLEVTTLDSQPFLTINGLQTMSYTYCNMLQELDYLQQIGINRFRIYPHDHNMLKIIDVYNDVLSKTISAEEGYNNLKLITPDVNFSNGFFHGTSGYKMIQSAVPQIVE
ncbi:MAG: U32 family peptidase [Legionellales bacterium]|nr:U32 family peptidase [Legionellales bacterium]